MQITRLANLEAGGRDDSEFIRWQEEMKQVTMIHTLTSLCALCFIIICVQKEIAEKTAEVERKHLVSFRIQRSICFDVKFFRSKEGQLSHEEAKIAKQNFIKMTQHNAQLLKEEVKHSYDIIVSIACAV